MQLGESDLDSMNSCVEQKVDWLMKNILLVVLILLLTGCSGEVAAPSPSATPGPTSAPVQATATSTLSTFTPLTSPPATQAPTDTLPPTPTETTPPSPITFQGMPDPAAYVWRPVVSGLQKPLGLASAADGTGRLFVVEQAGRIQVALNGQLLPEPYLDITSRVGSRGNEQGLLGLAFHPRYAENGFFYVNYTDLNGDTVIARFQVSPDDPNRADPSSEKRLLSIPQPFQNHNGGAVAFGPDGYLYLGLGDGGSAGDPEGNGQSLDTLLGKILRIDVDNGDPYAIPPDNPFASGGGRPEIWAYGLRNPWRFSFDRLTGDLYIGDVGQNQIEEIDFQPLGAPGGANFGWKFFEGSSKYEGAPPPGLQAIPPVAEYRHEMGCSVTGGVVYRGSRLPAWQGIYLFGDYCTGLVWGLAQDTGGNWKNQMLFEPVGRITSFGQDEQGEVYLVDQGGVVYVLDAK
jgi:glucose/arabinose dehydrogenase